LKGEACGCFPADSLHQFCGDLCWKFWFKCSRVDLCFDDYERIKTPSEVYRECCCGEEKKYSGFRRHRYIVEEKSNGEKSGDTLYFGTRGKNGGGKLMRCYDKNLESKGEIDSIRWEVEFSKDRASELFYRIAISGSLEEFVTHIAAFIGGAMDFIERNGKNLDRAHRMAFWERILAILGSSSIRNPRPLKTIEKAKDWIERSVTPSLGMLRKAFGNDIYVLWIETLVKDACLSKYQRRVVEIFMARNNTETSFRADSKECLE
jgi:DNA relaxase NicK